MTPRQSTAPKPPRKHVTTACNPCREGKVKCDGITPACTICRAKGKKCTYRSTDDKRKIPLRITIGVLAQRINQLSRCIQEQGLEVPSMSERDFKTMKDVFETVELKFEDINGTRRATSRPAIDASYAGLEAALASQSHELPETEVIGLQTPQPTIREQMLNVGEMLEPVSLGLNAAQPISQGTGTSASTAPVGNNISSPNVASALLELADPSWRHPPPVEPPHEAAPLVGTSDEEEEDEVTNQLSCRLGKLQVTHGGQLRYYGSTSNFTLLDVLVEVAPTSPVSITRGTQETLENAGLALDVDEPFEKHLLQLYFTWHDPCMHAVSEDVFWRSRAQKMYEGLDTPYYSRALSDAMCAVGASYESKYHPDLVTFPRSLAEFFGDRARLLVESDLETPSLATIQSLVILSAYEASCTRDTRGWLYSGMAMRLAFDLGLHLDMAPYVERGTILGEDAEARQVTFWAAYMSEQFWGYYLGRPTRNTTGGITVPKPGGMPNCPVPPLKWQQYGSPYLSKNMANLPNPLGLVCFQWVSLYEVMLPLTDVLYGNCEISKHRLQELTSNTVENLRRWKESLPPELKIYDTADFLQPLPHILALHMQYNQLMIHCHRPYISRHHIQPQPPQGPGHFHARSMCLESAIGIAKLLTIYERYYTFRRTNFQIVSFIFSAALILIFAVVPSSRHTEGGAGGDQELLVHLSTCFRALDEMGNQFESAKRTSTLLNTLQREWQARRRSRAARGVKRKLDAVQHLTEHSVLGQGVHPQFESPETGLWGGLDAITDGHAAYAVDFIEPDLCNILLSEGIPRSFI
ncbi:fungal-specific transcription factor domain-containing protein [Aspergillus pseudodeflectus]|uniref:Fungal-specific transcription factor domain-containing protein n=1 Tax=Aspergillus pseudodeflectus TaxID=176178 RepID=A0ABR4KWN6_9EURO